MSLNKCVIFFMEGDTECEFYKKLVEHIKNKCPNKKLNSYIEFVNIQGIGGFKNIALRKFNKEIKPKYWRDKNRNINRKIEFIAVLCSDTDVFELSHKPPIEWDNVKKDFKKNDAKRVISLQANKSIEDWFLYDLEGILKFLNLSSKTNVKGKNGQDKIKKLFIKANKVYIKGKKCGGLIDFLSIDKIEKSISEQLDELYEVFEIKD